MALINLNEKDTEYCISSTLNSFVPNDEFKEFKTSLDTDIKKIYEKIDYVDNEVDDNYSTLVNSIDSLRNNISTFNTDLRERINDNDSHMNNKFSMFERSIESRMKTINAFLIAQSIIIIGLISYIITIR